VHRDSYVEVERAFYEAPPELIGRQIWVRWDSRCVRTFNERMEQVAMHTRQEPGRFSHCLGAGGLSAPVLSSCRYWVNRAAVLGEQCGQWAQGALDARGPEALRSIDVGAELLRALGVNGDEAELRSASSEFGGHCLALTLLGSYLSDAYKGDIRRRSQVSGHLAQDVRQGVHARK
jgi:hypothetical protein